MSSLLHCSFCFFDQHLSREAIDLDARESVTIINGHATCLYHAEFAGAPVWLDCIKALNRRNVTTFVVDQDEKPQSTFPMDYRNGEK